MNLSIAPRGAARVSMAFVGAFAALAASAAHAAQYHLVDLGKATAAGINDAGIVVGNKLDLARPMRFKGDRWRAVQEPDAGAAALAINGKGDLGGYVRTDDQHVLPAIWARGTAGYTTLALPDGVTDGIASAIGRDGQAAGYSPGGHCLTWDESGNVTDIGKPAGSTHGCQVTGMNQRGELSVFAPPRGYVWRNGRYHDIGTLGGSSAIAFAVNRHGQVAGTATDASAVGHAVVWESGTMIDLGTPDWRFSGLTAKAINDDGVAVGDGWTTDDGVTRAVLYEGGQAFELNTLVDDLADWNLASATGISNDGTIVGYGTRGLHHRHAFMLVPIEAP